MHKQGSSSKKNEDFKSPAVSVIMGSKSDYDTMELCVKVLQELDVSFEVKVVSAHRTPERMYNFAKNAATRGVKVIIAAAGGAAHLPGMVASLTHLPVIGVPIQSRALSGLDSLLSIVQMPFGVPVATVAIGDGGAKNAAVLAASILACSDEAVKQSLMLFRDRQTDSVKEDV